MILFLEIWAGLFYLLNKIFFAVSERNRKEKWKVYSWIIYLVGLPAWVIVFILEKNWIAASIETGGSLSMVLGLLIAIRGIGKEPKWLNVASILFVIVGISYGVYDFGGINTINQVLELVMVSGFLVGTYSLAKQKVMDTFCFS